MGIRKRKKRQLLILKRLKSTDVGGIYVQIGATAANTTTYSDTDLDKSTTYYYRIRSYNGTNNSDFSAEANATTTSSDGGGGGCCFIATAGFSSHLDSSADFIREHESAKNVTRWMLYPVVGLAYIALHNTIAQQISFGLALLATLRFVTFRRKCRR